MTGEVLSDREIRELIDNGHILHADPSLVNPSSLDLRLSGDNWRLLGSVLPLPGQDVRDLIKTSGAVDDHVVSYPGLYLHKDLPFLVLLSESLDLPPGITARVFNKSGRGRIGTSVRTLADGVPVFDNIPEGYQGGLYAQVCATVFPELASPEKTTMPQIRFYRGVPQPIVGVDLVSCLNQETFLLDRNDVPVEFGELGLTEIARGGKLTFTADLSRSLLAYKARLDNKIIDLEQRDYYNPADFFEPIRARNGEDHLIIHPGEFVLIHSREKIRLPPGFAAEISDYSSEMGDMKCHYAGLINPGHGFHPDVMRGDHIVFEVRARDLPICIQDGQRLAQFDVYRMSETPEIQYRDVQSTTYDSLADILPVQFKKN